MARKTAAKRRTRRATKAKEKQAAAMNPGRRYELVGLAIFAAGLLSLCGLFGLNVGFVGLSFAKVLQYLFGIGAIVPTLLLLLIGWLYMTKHHGTRYSMRFFGLCLLYLSALAIWHHFVIPPGREILPDSLARGGGLAGGTVLFVLRKFFGVDGTILLLGIAVVGAVLLSTTWSLARGLLKTQEKVEKGASATAGAMETALSVTASKAAEAGSAVTEHVSEKVAALRRKHSFYNQEKDTHFQEEREDPAVMPEEPHTETVRASEVTKVADAEPPSEAVPKFQIAYSSDRAADAAEAGESADPSGGWVPDVASQAPGAEMSDVASQAPGQAADAAPETKPYALPKVTEILTKHVKKKNKAMAIEIEENARTLQQTLENFKVKATILNACHGPAVTRYELEPAPGVKVSKITNLSEDIALALAATSVRIEPIPGKAA
ncbi:MAG: DNA translocase FtsK 4TM domain-containing protein, partial [Selenomonadaceae bacterium]|nr:DNA translocase FtsK 4TM domain-containing protein [Selenomonadaceae bacterium]